jgi:hypothetical protein
VRQISRAEFFREMYGGLGEDIVAVKVTVKVTVKP